MLRKKYVKQPISEEVLEDGGAVAIFVDKETIPLETSIKESLQGNYAIGQETLIKSHFNGLMQSMIAGLLRDGHPRTLGNLITVFLVVKGEIDLEKGWDEEVNSLRVKARLLNELELDVTDWVFEDVTPGKRSFTLSTVKAGDVKGEYVIGETGEINGNNLPNTEFGEEMRVDWALEDGSKSGTLDSTKVTSDATRIDIDADALDELKDVVYDGKTIVFTVRGNFSNAKISAKLVVSAPPEVRITNSSATYVDAVGVNGTLTGENLQFIAGDTLTFSITPEGEETPQTGNATVTESSATSLTYQVRHESFGVEWIDKPLNLTLTSRAGVVGAPDQVNTASPVVRE